MVDQTRDQTGRVRARLLDLVPGRSGKVYGDWLDQRGEAFRQRVQVATLELFHGYKNAIDDHLEDATAVLDAFHVVKLGTDAVDQVRRRRTPRRGLLRLVLRPTTQRGLPPPRPRRRQEHRGADHQVAPTCPIPEILRLSRTLKQWREAFLAYSTTSRSSNGGTEAINGLIELYRRVARGFKDPGNYRLRIDAPHRWRTHQPPAQLRGARLITEFRSPGVRAR